MLNETEMRPFKFWCQKVLPLVYDESLSYYEVLCKVVKYINNLIAQEKLIVDDMEDLRTALKEVQDILDNFDTEYAERVIRETIATMIFIEITDAGYIVYYIPEEWKEIVFNTTGLDIEIEDVSEYGRLVLSY